MYPQCPFVRDQDVGNISLQNSALTLGVPGSSTDMMTLQRSPSRTDHPMDQGHDEAGIRPHRHPNSGPEKGMYIGSPCRKKVNSIVQYLYKNFFYYLRCKSLNVSTADNSK